MNTSEGRLRQIPAVQTVIRGVGDLPEVAATWIHEATRQVLDEIRQTVLRGAEVPRLDEIEARVRARARELNRPHLRPVINATGVMIHTNLGRAPLPGEMMAHLSAVATQYSTLEYRLEAGERGSRHEHVEGLLADLVGAEAAMVVNNNAAAVLLALATVASGREVVVSRGELVEIGGSFRIPDVMALSGATLVEAGATNKTHGYDYERAINDNTALLLKVHQSNFRQVGFVDSVDRAELVAIAEAHQLPVMEDLGSGVLLPIRMDGWAEPTVQQVVQAGVDITTFSGDKLLGGPQAGLVVGRREWIQRMKKHPLARAVRVDKMTLAVLELVLRWYREGRGQALPLWHMISMDAQEVKARAEVLAERLKAACPGLMLDIEPDWSEIGGGSMPGTRVPSFVLTVALSPGKLTHTERALRRGPTPVIVRVKAGKLVIDLRTVFPDQEHPLLDALIAQLHPAHQGLGGSV